MIQEWDNLNQTALKLYNSISQDKQGAFFQLVLHPVQASATVSKMWIYAGVNNMRVSQARISANDFVTEVESLFEQDYALEHEYHTILDGMTAILFTEISFS